MQKVIRFNGVQGDVEINIYGDADRETFISVVKNNEFVVVD